MVMNMKFIISSVLIACIDNRCSTKQYTIWATIAYIAYKLLGLFHSTCHFQCI